MRKRELDSTGLQSITDDVVLGPQVFRLGSGGYPAGPVTALNKSGQRSVIEDVDGNFGEDNPCYHFTDKWIVSPGGCSFSLHYHDGAIDGEAIHGTFWFQNAWSFASSCYPALETGPSLTNHPDTTDPNARWEIPNYAYEAWTSIYPVIKDRLSLLNSIYELKDFKRLPQLLRNTRRTFGQLQELSQGYRWVSEAAKQGELRLLYKLLQGPVNPNVWSTLTGLKWKRLKKLPLSSLLQAMVSTGRISAEHLLNWKFALEPLTRDIAACFQAAAATAQQVDALLNRANSDLVHRSHWSRILPSNEIGGATLADESTPFSSQGPASMRVLKRFSEDPKYTFTARYRFSYPPMSRELAHRLGMMDALGIHLSPKNVWNAIPWTFVIDWFVKISSTLDGLTPHHLEPRVELLGSCQSIKYKYSSEAQLYPYWVMKESADARWTIVSAPTTVLTREQECYIRQSIVPFVSLPKTSDFSTLEKVLAIALGVSSIRFPTG